MITFDEFLVQYNDVVAEAYEELGLSNTAKEAIVTIMRKYLGNRRFDPVDLINLFQTVCYSAMHRGQLSRKAIEEKVNREMDKYLADEGYDNEYTEESFRNVEIKGL